MIEEIDRLFVQKNIHKDPQINSETIIMYKKILKNLSVNWWDFVYNNKCSLPNFLTLSANL